MIMQSPPQASEQIIMSASATPSVPLKYIALPIITVAIWSINIIVTRMAADVIEPMAISFYRWFVAALILTPIMLPKVWRTRHIIRPHLGKLAVLGLLGMVLYQGMAYIAAQTTTATNMGIINAFLPLFTMIVGMIVLRERPTLFIIIGGALSLYGLGMLLGHGDPSSLIRQGVHLGDGLMVIGCLLFAIYSVLLRLWRLPIDLWSILYIQICVAVLVQLPVVLFMGGGSALNIHNISLVLYAGIFASLLAPFLWARAIHHLGPSRTSIFMNLIPVFTALIAAVFLNEQLHWYHLIGGMLTLLGVMLTQVNITKIKLILHGRSSLKVS